MRPVSPDSTPEEARQWLQDYADHMAALLEQQGGKCQICGEAITTDLFDSYEVVGFPTIGEVNEPCEYDGAEVRDVRPGPVAVCGWCEEDIREGDVDSLEAAIGLRDHTVVYGEVAAS